MEVMTYHPITVKPDTSLLHVKNLFDKEPIHHIPVIDDNGCLVGVLSKSDLLLVLDWGTKFNLKSSQVINDTLLNSNTASEICTTNIMSVKPEDTLQMCYELFRENYFRSLPVIDSEKRLLGIITPFDLMTAAFR
jgi:CBS domain-containing membrane protein